MAFTDITLTGTFTDPDGGAARGWLRFTPTAAMTNDGIVVAAAPVVAFLNSSGVLSIVLVATTDPGTTTASGAPAVYRVEELITGQRPRAYRIVLTHTDTTQNIVDITPEA